ncbi:MAG: right-handed parallel beta-helix repeat-containing protein, partial [Myxococcota bacterium]|nr:right-handed parallel beta-helix repeat-containing protein [Myxococcota bacterium]
DVQVLDTQVDPSSGMGGRGIEVLIESTLDASDCELIGNQGIGLHAMMFSTATLERVRIAETQRNMFGTAALGIHAQYWAVVEGSDVVIEDNDGLGIYTVIDGSVSCTGCTLQDNAFAGVGVQGGGELIIEDSVIEGTVAEANSGGGVGVFASDDGLSMFGRSELILRNSTVRDNVMGAVYIEGEGGFQVIGNELHGGAGLDMEPGRWAHGDALLVKQGEGSTDAWDEEDQLGVLIEDNTLMDSTGAGLFLDGADVTLANNTYDGNTT